MVPVHFSLLNLCSKNTTGFKLSHPFFCLWLLKIHTHNKEYTHEHTNVLSALLLVVSLSRPLLVLLHILLCSLFPSAPSSTRCYHSSVEKSAGNNKFGLSAGPRFDSGRKPVNSNQYGCEQIDPQARVPNYCFKYQKHQGCFLPHASAHELRNFLVNWVADNEWMMC